MSSININDSSFSKAGEINVNTEAGSNKSWVNHAIKSISSSSNAAILSVALAFSPTPGNAHDHSTDHKVESKNAASIMSAPTKENARAFEILNLYKEMLTSKDVDSFKVNRNNLDIQIMSGGEFLSGGNLHEKTGSHYIRDKNEHGNRRVNSMDKHMRESSVIPGAALSTTTTANINFGVPEDKRGNFCVVNLNMHVKDVHEFFKANLGLTDKVVAKLLTRHELSHCLETGDTNNLAVSAVTGVKTPSLVLPTDETTKLIVGHARNINEHYKEKTSSMTPEQLSSPEIKEQLLEAKFNTTIKHGIQKAGANQSEEYSDALSILTVLKEGDISLGDAVNFAKLRESRWGRDKVHDTSSMIVNIAEHLRSNPEILKKWQSDHLKEQRQGMPLQIQDVEQWLLPVWRKHAAAKDYNHHEEVGSKLTVIPGFNEKSEKNEVKNSQEPGVEGILKTLSVDANNDDKFKKTMPSLR